MFLPNGIGSKAASQDTSWSRITAWWSHLKAVEGQLWSPGLPTGLPKPKPRSSPAYSSSSSVVNKFSRNPVSPPEGFWMSKPPSSRARKFSSSLARGLGAMFSCRKQQWARWAITWEIGAARSFDISYMSFIYFWYSIHVLQRDINTFPCYSWDRLCR